MNKAFEKNLEIEKIKVASAEIVVHGTSKKPYYEIRYYDISDGKYHIGYSSYDLSIVFGWLKECFEIVHEIAEEYKDKPNIIDGLKIFLQEKFNYCAEQAEMNLEAECNSEIASYFRDIKELYLDRANIYGEVMREIDRLAVEYNNGWIPCSDRLPEAEEDVLLSLRSLDVYTGFRANAEGCFYIDGDGYVEYENVIAWMPLPEPYKESEG